MSQLKTNVNRFNKLSAYRMKYTDPVVDTQEHTLKQILIIIVRVRMM